METNPNTIQPSSPWGRTPPGNASASAPKQSSIITEAVKARITPKAKVEIKEDTRFKEVSANPFYKIIFDEKADDEQKADAVAKTLTIETVKDYLMFDEWLASTREKMASDLIALNDSDGVSELHQTINQMGQDLLNFEEQAKPFTEILDSVYTLRTNNVAFDAIKEVKEHKAKMDDLSKQLDVVSNKIAELDEEVTNLNRDTAKQEQNTNLFGYIKQSSRETIAENKTRIDAIALELPTLGEKQKDLANQLAALDDTQGEFAKEKKTLREMLDVSAPEHKERSEALKTAAQNFIKISKERIGSIREHISAREEQINRFKKANKNLLMVYATLEQGVGKAFDSNREKSAELAQEKPGETLLVKAKREQTKETVDQFVKTLEGVKGETLKAFASVTRQGVTVNSMKDGNDKSISTVRNLHTQSIAEVAENMSVMMEGIAGAALGEASAVAQDVLNRMNSNTSQMSQKEVIKQAMSVNDEIGQIKVTMYNLTEMGNTLTAAKQLHRDSLQTLRQASSDLLGKAREVVDATQDATAVNAELGAETKNTTSPSTTVTNPLGL